MSIDTALILRSLPNTPWGIFKHGENTWSVIPTSHRQAYLKVLQRFILSEEELKALNFIQAPLSLSKIKEMSRCYSCNSKAAKAPFLCIADSH